jgi:hypothetical protein
MEIDDQYQPLSENKSNNSSIPPSYYNINHMYQDIQALQWDSNTKFNLLEKSLSILYEKMSALQFEVDRISDQIEFINKKRKRD